jgi:ParB-like chromosome segregation protein Spo0J
MIGLGGRARAHTSLGGLLEDVGTLRPHLDNPRNGDLDAIAESILTNGLYRPVYAQRSTGMILAGNHTYAAALGLGAERLPVVWLDVDDSLARRILLADNKIADLGQYDQAQLLDLLKTVVVEPDALLGTGYVPDDIAHIEALLADIEDRSLEGLEELNPPRFGIIVECESEREQRDLLTRFATEGIKARSVIA